MTFDAERARKDFPILSRTVHGKPLVFLDSAASAQKPQDVIDAISRLYHRTNITNTNFRFKGINLFLKITSDFFDQI